MEYYHFFVDVWRLFRKYKMIAANTEEYFDSLFFAARKIAERYKYMPFVMDIISAIMEELKRIAVQGGENENNNQQNKENN